MYLFSFPFLLQLHSSRCLLQIASDISLSNLLYDFPARLAEVEAERARIHEVPHLHQPIPLALHSALDGDLAHVSGMAEVTDAETLGASVTVDEATYGDASSGLCQASGMSNGEDQAAESCGLLEGNVDDSMQRETTFLLGGEEMGVADCGDGPPVVTGRGGVGGISHQEGRPGTAFSLDPSSDRLGERMATELPFSSDSALPMQRDLDDVDIGIDPRPQSGPQMNDPVAEDVDAEDQVFDVS